MTLALRCRLSHQGGVHPIKSEREGYTDQVSQELLGIIIAAIALAAILVPGQWALRPDIAALGESTRKELADLNERMAKVEGLFEGFTKSSPQSTPQ